MILGEIKRKKVLERMWVCKREEEKESLEEVIVETKCNHENVILLHNFLCTHFSPLSCHLAWDPQFKQVPIPPIPL